MFPVAEDVSGRGRCFRLRKMFPVAEDVSGCGRCFRSRKMFPVTEDVSDHSSAHLECAIISDIFVLLINYLIIIKDMLVTKIYKHIRPSQ